MGQFELENSSKDEYKILWCKKIDCDISGSMGSKEMPPIKDQLTLEYFGPPTEMGRMNSYDVASYIIAFSDYLGIISRRAYGERIELQTDIQGFRKDTFDIDFALQIAGQIAGLTTTVITGTPKELLILIKETIKAWIHLHGYPPKMVSQLPKKNSFQVENQNGQIQYFNADVINIITNPKAGKAVEQFIKKPLEGGVSSLRINSKSSDEVVKIEDKDAPSFIHVDFEKPLTENEIPMHLLIESPTFKENNKWKFNDGQTSFYADIIDEDFLKRVDSGKERFGKGDALKVTLRLSQLGTTGSLRMERTIVRVLEHEIGIESDKLL